jgi:protein YibB
MSEITIVTAFFDIGRAEFKNTHLTRTNEQYFEYFRFWARMKNKLIVYTDSISAQRVKNIRKEFGLEGKTIVITIDNVYEIEPDIYKCMLKVSESLDFKSFRYFENAMSNRANYDYVMLMKYWCMKRTVEQNLADGMIAWMDFGFNHGGKCYINPEEFDFEWKFDFNSKIQIFSFRLPDTVSGVTSLQFLFDTIMGCPVLCPSQYCEDLWVLVKDAMEALLMIDCIDDDQQLLLMAYKRRSDLFEVHKSNWFMPLKEYGGEHLTVRETTLQKQEKILYNKILSLLKHIPGMKKADSRKQFSKRMYQTAAKYYK